MPMADALIYVGLVIRGGRISKNNTAYCYLTTWKDGTAVSATKNMKSDSFLVWKQAAAQEGK